MSILAQPKRKVRYSIDPQNVTWKNDEDKFGKRLMEKMGWSSGKGLGRNLHGAADNIKLRANHSGKGLGANAQQDMTWIAAHDDFADILKALNKNKPPAEGESEESAEERRKKMSMELVSKSVRRRIHYQKFTRAKDIGQYSEKEKSAIFGLKGGEARKAEEEKGSEKDEVKKGVEGGEKKGADDVSSSPEKTQILTKSSLSVADYFASKMAALKAKRAGAAQEASNKANEEEGVIEEAEAGDEEEAVVAAQAGEEERKRRKREKKERKRREREQAQVQQKADEQVATVEEAPLVEDAAAEVDPEKEERKRRKREKKERKRREREEADATATATKRHDDDDAEEAAGEEEVPTKRRRVEEFAPPTPYHNDDNAAVPNEKPKKKKNKKESQV